MKPASLLRALPLLALAAAPSGALPPPPCPPQPIHFYLGPEGWAAVATSSGVDLAAGGVVVADTNLADCDADGVPGDFDGDYNVGLGGAFFGWGPWAAAPVCGYGVNAFGPDVVVADAAWGPAVTLWTGADDTDGPVILTDPVTGAISCETDGSISPTFDPDDCLAGPYVGIGATCGGGGDGGYWVVLAHAVEEALPAGVLASNPPTVGAVMAGFFGAPFVPYAGAGYAVAVVRA